MSIDERCGTRRRGADQVLTEPADAEAIDTRELLGAPRYRILDRTLDPSTHPIAAVGWSRTLSHEVMSDSFRRAWVRAALLFGVAYFLIGRLFALPTDNVHAWRVAAWVVSGVAYSAHIGYEHFRLRNTPRSAALHVALAVALGAFALAVAGMIHSLSAGSEMRPTWLLALVIWPATSAIPAFVGALVAGTVVTRISRRADAE
jgi:hypothetical protein